MKAKNLNDKLLSELKPGDKGIIKSVVGGRRLRQKLYGLGIFRGRDLCVIKGCQKHPYLVDVCGVKCVIGCGMAEKIIVE